MLVPSAGRCDSVEALQHRWDRRGSECADESEPQVVYALTKVKGVGRRFGHAVVTRAGIDASKRAGQLSAEVSARDTASASGYSGSLIW